MRLKLILLKFFKTCLCESIFRHKANHLSSAPMFSSPCRVSLCLGVLLCPVLFLYLLRAQIPLLSFEGATEFVTNLFPFELYTTLFEVCWTVDTDVQLKWKWLSPVEFLASSSGFRVARGRRGEIRATWHLSRHRVGKQAAKIFQNLITGLILIFQYWWLPLLYWRPLFSEIGKLDTS